ncbi:rhodanese-like domain-containing protein [Pleomorphovibrio marinus]|uniref:rhodanese-like domain-containing protein n=1 Tax=Pleomorphovibrio marinus TaxID=2164132 RepID=UPI0029372934|nr:rhodanese-like domain-containing protein [Pleomorphovibrio marinus]
MMALSRLLIFVALCVWQVPFSYAQSLPFKTLLKSTYEKDFPLVYPEQNDFLDNAVILDTREKEEFAVSHIRSARWVGYETFTLESVTDIPKDKTIVVYCSIGARSQEIGKKLISEGYQNVYNLYGGIFHWVNEENPVFTDEGIQTNSVHTYNKSWGIWVKKGEKVY